MKKLFFILCVLTAFVACSDDKDNDPTSPIENLKMPSSETPFTTGQSVTIEGKGFTASSQIWLRTTTKATGDIQTNITEVTNNSITFEVPEGVEGKHNVILKQEGKEYELGTLQIQKHETKFYTFCYDDDKNELAEIDLQTGKLIWTGLKIPTYANNSRGYVFNEKTNEFITFGDNGDWIINKLNMENGSVITLKLDKDSQQRDYDNIIKSNNKFYTFCYDDDKNELAEIDLQTGKLIWTGLKIPTYANNSRGYVFNEKTNEFITFGDNGDWIINKLNMKNGSVITLKLDKDSQQRDYDNIIKSNNKFYTFCYDNDKNELAEIDLQTGKLIWTGLKIPTYANNSRGYVFNEKTNEFITFGDNGDWIINKLNMKNGSVITLKLDKDSQQRDYDDIITF